MEQSDREENLLAIWLLSYWTFSSLFTKASVCQLSYQLAIAFKITLFSSKLKLTAKLKSKLLLLPVPLLLV